MQAGDSHYDRFDIALFIGIVFNIGVDIMTLIIKSVGIS
jgi:hypothetical protein